ncbi:hypothetical protein P152DRAFT_477597 [Eremomyces bilateralis CBS 781.70]|uniref:Uncharacterized protein n=1 Tax=Eremomyces bilateralis CBS 781.70 TaxID=1392243 RepID=A0A6G1FQL6_9PEZI|nr:uncharacterized protein P152DRAFT_477597 [Eremomyces bilateralis CBS 781.70]KAF1808125.1 hypothetical protein P152DRAFT_477597 [Eremomyces bilateralis CBS 781.70]
MRQESRWINAIPAKMFNGNCLVEILTVQHICTGTLIGCTYMYLNKKCFNLPFSP